MTSRSLDATKVHGQIYEQIGGHIAVWLQYSIDKYGSVDGS